MGQINLLPWREEERQRKTREFSSIAGLTAIAAILLVFAGRMYVNGVVDYHKSRNQFLQNQIDVLNTKLQEIKDLEETKSKLLARMDIIQSLQRSRPEIVHLFEELVTTIPEGVWLASMIQKGKNLSLVGKAESNARVSAYMRNIESSDWLKSPVLQEIKADKDTRTATFKLVLQQENHLGTKDGEGK